MCACACARARPTERNQCFLTLPFVCLSRDLLFLLPLLSLCHRGFPPSLPASSPRRGACPSGAWGPGPRARVPGAAGSRPRLAEAQCPPPSAAGQLGLPLLPACACGVLTGNSARFGNHAATSAVKFSRTLGSVLKLVLVFKRRQSHKGELTKS